MKMYPVITVGKTIQQVMAKEFSSEVQGQTFNFLVHESLNHGGKLVVTHKESGMGVCAISQITKKSVEDSDAVDLAKVSLEAFVKLTGVARVRSVLAGAKTIEENVDAE